MSLIAGRGCRWPPRRDSVSPCAPLSGGRDTHDGHENSPILVFFSNLLEGSVLYLQEVDEVEVREVPGSEGAQDPFFSLDGQWIGFESVQRSALMKAPVSGGPPIAIVGDANTTGVVWGPDETLFVAKGTRGLWRVSAGGGGTEERLTPPDSETSYLEPRILPQGDDLVLTAGGAVLRTSA